VNKPPKSAFHLTDEAGDTFISIRDGESVFLCTDTEGEQECIRFPEDSELAGTLVPVVDVDSIIEDAAEEGAEVKEIDGREIAGVDAKCYDVKDDTGSGVLCASEDDGVMLLLDGTFDGEESKFEAIEYTASADDGAFEPPYPFSELP
jgi:hypothetical protein